MRELGPEEVEPPQSPMSQRSKSRLSEKTMTEVTANPNLDPKNESGVD